jgi:hypothetical protein
VRRLYVRLGWQQARLLLWAVISAALLAIALLLNTSGHSACIQPMGTACPSLLSHSGHDPPAFKPMRHLMIIVS